MRTGHERDPPFTRWNQWTRVGTEICENRHPRGISLADLSGSVAKHYPDGSRELTAVGTAVASGFRALVSRRPRHRPPCFPATMANLPSGSPGSNGELYSTVSDYGDDFQVSTERADVSTQGRD